MGIAANRLTGPRGTQQLRQLRRLFADPHTALDEMSETYGRLFGFEVGPVRLAVVGDAGALRELFAMPKDSFRWNHRFNVLKVVVGEGSMIVSDGDEHARRRGAVQTAFSRRRLNGWIPMIIERTDAAIDALEARDTDEPLDLYPVGLSVVLAVVVNALFGPRLAERATEIGTLFERPQAYLEAPAVRQLPHPLPFTTRARVKADRRALDAIIDAEIAERRRNPSGDGLDLLEALVAEGTLSDGEIRDQVASLIGAGYNTTAAALAWMLWEALLAPSLWQELRDEADRILGPPGGPVRADPSVLAELALADAVMHESLRLHPASVVSPREAAVDIELGGFTIPKGTLVMWSAHLAGRDPAVWPDPMRFDPGRFERDGADRRESISWAWVPFGRGTRNCIGFALAQMELVLMLARFAQRLDLETMGHRVPAPHGLVVNRPEGGLVVRARARGTSPIG